LKAVFDNDKDILFPNQFVNIHLLVDTKHNMTVVPTPAIQRGPQGTYVYLVQKDNTVKIQPVTVALSASNAVGITDGLQPGDTVVTDGQDKLQDGSRVDAHASTGGAPSSLGQAQGSAPSQISSPTTQSPNSNPQSTPARKGKNR